jgi:SAM-dependent methyltransferase
MHPSAQKIGALFFECYAKVLPAGTVVDVGAQDVNGSLKGVCPSHLKYVGVDVVGGKGVDVLLKDPYQLPFDSDSIDFVISSSCFEHSELFWVLFLEILRILKPSGLFYLNAPSNGVVHRYPVDCWRFYPDSALALVTWAKRNRYEPALLESFIARQDADSFNDFVAVFVKHASRSAEYPTRIIATKTDFANGRTDQSSAILNAREVPEDLEKLLLIQRVLAGQIKAG